MNFKQFLIEEQEITVYHGTDHKIEKFKGIVYFTPREDAAQGYARGKARMNKKDAFVYEIKLSLKNPKLFKTMQQIGTLSQSDIDVLKKEGFDGAFYDGSGKESIPEYVPFYPDDLKIVKVHTISTK